MQNTDFFDIMIFFLCSLVWLCFMVTESVAAAGGDLHVQLVVNIPDLRDPVGDFTDETFFFFAVDRPAQGDPAINGDDLHVLGIHGHSLGSDDFFANLRRGIQVSLAVALIERGQRAVITITNILSGVISGRRRFGVEVRLNPVGVIHSAGITGLGEIRPLIGLEVR